MHALNASNWFSFALVMHIVQLLAINTDPWIVPVSESNKAEYHHQAEHNFLNKPKLFLLSKFYSLLQFQYDHKLA